MKCMLLSWPGQLLEETLDPSKSSWSLGGIRSSKETGRQFKYHQFHISTCTSPFSNYLLCIFDLYSLQNRHLSQQRWLFQRVMARLFSWLESMDSSPVFSACDCLRRAILFEAQLDMSRALRLCCMDLMLFTKRESRYMRFRISQSMGLSTRLQKVCSLQLIYSDFLLEKYSLRYQQRGLSWTSFMIL